MDLLKSSSDENARGQRIPSYVRALLESHRSQAMSLYAVSLTRDHPCAALFAGRSSSLDSSGGHLCSLSAARRGQKSRLASRLICLACFARRVECRQQAVPVKFVRGIAFAVKVRIVSAKLRDGVRPGTAIKGFSSQKVPRGVFRRTEAAPKSKL